MMCFGEFLVGFEIDNQIVICARLPDAEPGKERNQKQHGDDRHVVRRGNNLPNLVPILDPIGEEAQQHNHNSQADISIAAGSCLRLSFDYRAHFFSSDLKICSLTSTISHLKFQISHLKF